MKHELEIRKVLIVDDEPGLREALSRIMKMQNIQTEVAENGQVALELLRKQDFHAVLCDIMMPELSGLDCLAQAQSEGIVTPFIFVTGFSDRGRMLQAIRLNATDFISKPFDNSEIVDVVFRVLEISNHKNRISNEIKNLNFEVKNRILKEERMISLMRANNNKKRS